jgi:regulator of replication initiation timing
MNTFSGPGQVLMSTEGGAIEWSTINGNDTAAELRVLRGQIIDMYSHFNELKKTMSTLVDNNAKLSIDNMDLRNKLNELAKGTAAHDDWNDNDSIEGHDMSVSEAKKLIDAAEPIIDASGNIHVSNDISSNIGAIVTLVKHLQKKL